jgi:hypothetical protein
MRLIRISSSGVVSAPDAPMNWSALARLIGAEFLDVIEGDGWSALFDDTASSRSLPVNELATALVERLSASRPYPELRGAVIFLDGDQDQSALSEVGLALTALQRERAEEFKGS